METLCREGLALIQYKMMVFNGRRVTVKVLVDMKILELF